MTEEPHILAARLWIDGICISRDTDWPQPLKYLSFQDRGLQVTSDKGSVRISVQKPTKNFVFEEREGVTVSDSGLDLVPGDEQIIEIHGLKENEKPLAWRYLGQDE
jgi:beta-mannosidase